MQYLARDLLHDSSSGADASGSGATDADLAQRVLRILGQLGVGATHLGTDEGPRLTRLTLELHQLEDLDRIRKGVGKIAFALGMAQDAIGLNLALVEKRVHLFVPRTPSRWRSVGWPELQPSLSGEAAKGMTLPICLGTDVLGEPFLIDLAEAPHLFIGGTTGSGKSVCLHSILLSLLEGDARAHLVLIDPKAVEFSAYAGSRRLRGPVVTTPEDAQLALESLITEMDNRQERFRELEARNLAEANAKGAGLPRIVAVIDELGDLFMTSKGIDVPLTRLAQKARSAGIHLVLATQRPEAATFPGLLRSNIPSRIALTVQKASESRIILDESGAETLLMRGDMLVRFAGRPTVRAHGCRVESADILKAVANT
jgi:S-DNA-T family DNA segregation ATPase FtsK/SpoIIIE